MKESREFLESKSCQTGYACTREAMEMAMAMVTVPIIPENAGNLESSIIWA